MKCVFAKTIYTGNSVKQNTFLVFSGQKIGGFSASRKGELIGEYAVLTPALIDAHSHIGMHRSGEPSAEGEANDHLDSIMALPDALDSVQMDDAAFKDAIEMGVLYSCVVPGSGNIVGGQAAVIRNYAPDSTSALVARAGVKAAFGYNPKSTTSWKGSRPSTRMGAAALLRSKLDEVQQKIRKYKAAKGAKKKEITFSGEENIYRDLLSGKTRLRAHVHKIDDIATLLRLVDEFKLKVTIEHAMDVHRPEIFRELKKRKIPVVYGPVDSFAYKVELKHENWRNIVHLVSSGVDFGLMTDHPVVLARQLLLQTRWFVRAGFSQQQAVELVTRQNAKILGLTRILGTLEKGKWASFVCWNGDPFNMASYPLAVYGEGALLFEDQGP
jgi:imidazolonepropionase-like amidohydrolase